MEICFIMVPICHCGRYVHQYNTHRLQSGSTILPLEFPQLIFLYGKIVDHMTIAKIVMMLFGPLTILMSISFRDSLNLETVYKKLLNVFSMQLWIPSCS